MKKSLFFMGIMLVLLIVSCDPTPKPVTDTIPNAIPEPVTEAIGVLTVEPTEQGNKLRFAINDDTNFIYINRKMNSDEISVDYMRIDNHEFDLKKGTYTFIDEFVEEGEIYAYRVKLHSPSSDTKVGSEVKSKAVGGKGSFMLTNKPKLSYDSSTNTFTFSEALSYSHSGFDSYLIDFHFTLGSTTYAGYYSLIENQLNFRYVHESIYDNQLYVKSIQGCGNTTQNGVSVRFETSNALDGTDLGFTGPFVIKKLN